MSSQLAPPEHVCYVHCNFCNTTLVVNVPRNSLFNIVIVRCGHCANLLSVNMEALLQSLPVQDFQNYNLGPQTNHMDYGSCSRCGRTPMLYSMENAQQQTLPIRPPEKRQRAPSAYIRDNACTVLEVMGAFWADVWLGLVWFTGLTHAVFLELYKRVCGFKISELKIWFTKFKNKFSRA